jgi:hypothetical protein
MQTKQRLILVLAILIAGGALAVGGQNETRRISMSALEDKIRGGWAGQKTAWAV